MTVPEVVPITRLRFVLTRLAYDGVQHALEPGRTRGATLYGVEQPLSDWILNGYTVRLEWIGCGDCRMEAEEAMELLARGGEHGG